MRRSDRACSHPRGIPFLGDKDDGFCSSRHQSCLQPHPQEAASSLAGGNLFNKALDNKIPNAERRRNRQRGPTGCSRMLQHLNPRQGQPGAQTLVVIAEVEEASAVEIPDFDLRIGNEHVDMELVDELKEVQLSSEDTSRVVRIGKNITRENK